MSGFADISQFEAIQNASPMLAETIGAVGETTYPSYVSEKLDGMRCIVDRNGLWTRTEHSLKPGMLEQFQPLVDLARDKGVVLDGEMYYPHHNDFGSLMSTMAASPEEIREKGVRFHLFDVVPEDEWEGESTESFTDRYGKYQQYAAEADPDQSYIIPVLQTLVNTPEEAQALFDAVKEQEGEGIMLRSPDAPYIHDRSDKLVKLKNWDSCEGVVTAVHRQKCPIKDADEVIDGVGYKNCAGSVTVQILPDQPLPPVEQNCAFIKGDDGKQLRKEFWENADDIIGKVVEFQYLRGGTKGRMARVFRMRPDKDVLPSI